MANSIAAMLMGAVAVHGFMLTFGLIRAVWFGGSWLKHKADRARTEAKALRRQFEAVV